MSPPQSPNSTSRDQIRPLAPSSHRIHIEKEEDGVNYLSASDTELAKKRRRRRRCIKCCGCCGVTTVIVGIVVLILALTVFKVKDPTIRMNSIRFDGLNALVSSNLQTNLNITVSADVSIKNPNSVSVKFRAATASLIYGDRDIAEALIPPGSARARRTFRMNVNVTVMVEKLVGIPRLMSDLVAGELPVSMVTKINGKVNLGLIKKSVGVRMNCAMVVDLQSQDVKDIDCERKVSL